MSEPNFYAIIPADVRYSKVLCANAKLLYGEITALANAKGFCYASNKYFADLYGVEKGTISGWVSKLVKAGFVRVEIENENERKIFILGLERPLPKKSDGDTIKPETPYDKNRTPPTIKIAHNITSNIKENKIENIEEKKPQVLRRDNDPFAIHYDIEKSELIYKEIESFFVAEYKTKPKPDKLACNDIGSLVVGNSNEEIKEEIQNKIQCFLYDPYWGSSRPTPRLLAKAWDQLSDKHIPKHLKNKLTEKESKEDDPIFDERMHQYPEFTEEEKRKNLDNLSRMLEDI